MRGSMHVLGVLACFFAASAAAAVEMKLVKAESQSHARGQCYRSGEPLPRVPDKEPAYKSRDYFYFTLSLGEGAKRHFVGAIDESGGTGTGFDRLYFDANNNGDLTDDKLANGHVEEWGRSGRHVKAQAEARVDYGDGSSRTVSLTVLIGIQTDDHGKVLSRDAYGQILRRTEGTLELDGEKVLVGLREQHNANGCFNDFGRDRLWLDLNGDGRWAYSEEQTLSKVFSHGGRTWSLEASASGTRLSIEPYTGPLAKVRVVCRLPAGTRIVEGRIELIGDNDCALTCDLAGQAATSLPPGKYRLNNADMELADNSGGKWTTYFYFPETRDVVLSEGKTAEVALGAPFSLVPKLNGRSRPGSKVDIDCEITGVGGEIWSPATQMSPPSPAVSIVDADGKKISGGAMEYG